MDRRWICGVAVGFLSALAGEVAAGQPAPGAPAAQPAKQDGRPFALMVGDQAPDLDVAWYQPQGPSRKVEKGRPYVVEFWATWCVPCVANIPHLTELQKKYGERVTIVGVSVWEPRPNEVEEFVKKQGARMDYNVALDSCPPAPANVDNPSDWAKENGKCSIAWLRASGWAGEGIPVAFIVDEEGRIAWTGDPREMDEPLAAVVEKRWDLAGYLPKYTKDMEVRLKAREIYQRRRAAARAGDHEGFLKASDELLALGPTMAVYSGGKFGYLLKTMKNRERAYAFAREAIAPGGVAHDNRDALNQIAQIIIGEGAKSDAAGLEIALAASTRAEDLTKSKEPEMLVTLAAVHAARQEYAKAVAAQRRAIACAREEEKPEMQKQLDEYAMKEAGR